MAKRALIPEVTNLTPQLTAAAWKPPAPIRLLNVTALHLTEAEETYEQTDLFAGGETSRSRRQERLEQTMDAIRDKFGAGAISYGGVRPLRREDPPEES